MPSSGQRESRNAGKTCLPVPCDSAHSPCPLAGMRLRHGGSWAGYRSSYLSGQRAAPPPRVCQAARKRPRLSGSRPFYSTSHANSRFYLSARSKTLPIVLPLHLSSVIFSRIIYATLYRLQDIFFIGEPSRWWDIWESHGRMAGSRKTQNIPGGGRQTAEDSTVFGGERGSRRSLQAAGG